MIVPERVKEKWVAPPHSLEKRLEKIQAELTEIKSVLDELKARIALLETTLASLIS